MPDHSDMQPAQQAKPLIQSPQSRVPTLDGLRAMSIIMVMISHQFQSYRLLNMLGPYGVQIFFLISGFIITHLLQQERQRAGSISLKRFYLRRILRILPAAYTYILFFVVLGTFGKIRDFSSKDVIAALTFTVNYIDGVKWVYQHLWSLSVEEQFYLIWPIIYIALSETNSKRFLILTVLTIPFVRLAAEYGIISREQMGCTFHTVADALATGCLLAMIGGPGELLDQIRRIPIWLASSIFLGGMACTLGLLYIHAPLDTVITPTIANITIAIFIGRMTATSDGPIFRVLNAPTVTAIGRWSFSLYLWQQPFLFQSANPKFYNMFPWNYCLVFTLALASYYLIEMPCHRLRKRLDL